MTGLVRRLLDKAGVMEAPPEPVTCPRRMLEMGPWKHEEGQDYWRKPAPAMGGSDLPVVTCSFCGSMRPDDVLEGLLSGALALGPTDKNYKAYVHVPGDADAVARAESKARDEAERMGVAWEHRDEHVRIQTMGAREGRTIAKLYFQHFDEGQRQAFVEALNEKKIKIGYPGRFYRLPFFVTQGE